MFTRNSRAGILRVIPVILFCVLSADYKCQPDNPYLYYAIDDLSMFMINDSSYNFALIDDHLNAIDIIYTHAVKYYKGDISEALLALTFVALPFPEMPLEIPFTGITIAIPLPSGNPDFIRQKIRNLPSHFLFDSPGGNFGDKDKLSHFFGSAFMSYNISFFNLSEFIGILIELFEESFKVEGGLSRRDLLVNKLGILFGESLNENKNLLPSDILKLYSLLNSKYIL